MLIIATCVYAEASLRPLFNALGSDIRSALPTYASIKDYVSSVQQEQQEFQEFLEQFGISRISRMTSRETLECFANRL